MEKIVKDLLRNIKDEKMKGKKLPRVGRVSTRHLITADQDPPYACC